MKALIDIDTAACIKAGHNFTSSTHGHVVEIDPAQLSQQHRDVLAFSYKAPERERGSGWVGAFPFALTPYGMRPIPMEAAHLAEPKKEAENIGQLCELRIHGSTGEFLCDGYRLRLIDPTLNGVLAYFDKLLAEQATKLEAIEANRRQKEAAEAERVRQAEESKAKAGKDISPLLELLEDDGITFEHITRIFHEEYGVELAEPGELRRIFLHNLIAGKWEAFKHLKSQLAEHGLCTKR